MIHDYRRHKDRRHKSAIKPLLFLLFEVIALAMIFSFVYLLSDLTILHVLVGIGLIYFFIVSSLKRYIMVRDRQRFYEE